MYNITNLLHHLRLSTEIFTVIIHIIVLNKNASCLCILAGTLKQTYW